MKNTLLLAENDLHDSETWGRILKDEGYRVITACNATEARQALREKLIDLAILDLRLEADNDALDYSGWVIAQEKEFQHIPKIVLSAFPISNEMFNEMLGPRPKELPRIMAFLNKSDGPETLIEAVHDALRIWTHLRMATTTVSEQNNAYYAIVEKQARNDYIMTYIVSGIGFLLIVAGIFMAWFTSLTTIVVVETASGFLLQVLGYLFIRRLDQTNARYDSGHQELLKAQWFEILLAAVQQLPASRRPACLENLIIAAAARELTSKNRKNLTSLVAHLQPADQEG